MAEPCAICQHRQAELMLYPHFAAYNASGERPRTAICGHCAAELLNAKTTVRVSPFAIVREESGVAVRDGKA